jgi:hypothetical protein
MELLSEGKDLALYIISLISGFIVNGELISPCENSLLDVQIHRYPPVTPWSPPPENALVDLGIWDRFPLYTV